MPHPPLLLKHPVFLLEYSYFYYYYSELTPYTVLANSYGVSVYDSYQFQGHTH